MNANCLIVCPPQLQELNETGFLSETRCEVHVVPSCTHVHRESLAAESIRWFSTARSVIQENPEANQFEYPGIRKVWQLGQRGEDAYLLYFHARGLSRTKLGHCHHISRPQEKHLFSRVIGEWQQNLTWFEHVISVYKLA